MQQQEQGTKHRVSQKVKGLQSVKSLFPAVFSFFQPLDSQSLLEALLSSLESGSLSLYSADPSSQRRTREELGAGRGAREQQILVLRTQGHPQGRVTHDHRDSLLLSPTPVRDLANSPMKAFLSGTMGHVNQVCEKNNKSPAMWPLCPFELAYLLPWLLLMEAKRLQNLPEA